jgi:hypothetical protein
LPLPNDILQKLIFHFQVFESSFTSTAWQQAIALGLLGGSSIANDRHVVKMHITEAKNNY